MAASRAEASQILRSLNGGVTESDIEIRRDLYFDYGVGEYFEVIDDRQRVIYVTIFGNEGFQLRCVQHTQTGPTICKALVTGRELVNLGVRYFN